MGFKSGICKKKIQPRFISTFEKKNIFSANHYLSEDQENVPPPSITTSTYKLKDDPQHQIENAIRKYEHDTMRNLIHYQSDKNVEFRTNKPRLSKKLCKYC